MESVQTICVKSILLLMFLVQFNCFGAGQRTSIAEWVRLSKQKNVVIMMQKDYVPVNLDSLMDKADLIGEFSISNTHSFVTEDNTEINSEILLIPLQIIRDDRDRYNRQQVFPGTSIMVRRNDGELIISGRQVTFQEEHFPFFKPGQKYILFLQYDPKLKEFTIPFGPYSVFAAKDQQVHALAPIGELSDKFDQIGKPEFLEVLKERARLSE
jgi:hypothetical protein